MSSESEPENLVRVGQKPTLNYVVACLTLFNSGYDEVVVKARGRSIAHAVDVVNKLKESFISNLEVRNVSIGSEEVDVGGKRLRLSTIELVIAKPSYQPTPTQTGQ